jgi:hypothetical protein
MNNLPAATKAKGTRPYQKKAKNFQAKPVEEAHECEVCDYSETEVATKTNITKSEVDKLPFGIKASQINKYIVYGEILATPACRKQRNR